MKRLFKMAVVGCALAVTSVVSAPGAGAVTVADVWLAGGGVVVPGINFTPQFQTITFAGSAAGTFADSSNSAEAGTCSVSFSGGSTIEETHAYGEGHGEAGCGGTSVTGRPLNVSCHVVYIRVGPVLILHDEPFADPDGPGPFIAHDDGSSCTGTATGRLRGVCTFEPVPLPPATTTSFLLTCHVNIYS